VCDRLRLKCVTRDGDIYDPHGTVTGGSRPRGNASLLVRMAQLREASQAAEAAGREAGATEGALAEARGRLEAHEAAAAELEMQVGGGGTGGRVCLVGVAEAVRVCGKGVPFFVGRGQDWLHGGIRWAALFVLV
jgi:hypothetical protein